MSASEQLHAAFANPFRVLGNSAHADQDAVVLAWPTVPVEIVHAAGLRAVLPHAVSTPTPTADAAVEPGIFPARLLQLLEAALTGRLAHVAAVILPRTSDADYKCYLYLREFARRGIGGPYPPVLLFDLLQSAGEAVPRYNHARAQQLFTQLAGITGRQASADELGQSIVRANAARAAGRRLQALRGAAPRLQGAEALPMLGAFWQLPADSYARLAIDAAAAASTRPLRSGPRILLAGAPVDSPVLHAHVESLGATVVDEISPFGNDAVRRDVPTDVDPLAALVRHHGSDPGTPRTRRSERRLRIEAALAHVDAVIFCQPPDDATFGWDYPALRASLARRDIPQVLLAADPAAAVTDSASRVIGQLLDAATGEQAVRHG